MKKVPFSLDSWLKDKTQKVYDETGAEYRIVCWDACPQYPVVAISPTGTAHQITPHGLELVGEKVIKYYLLQDTDIDEITVELFHFIREDRESFCGKSYEEIREEGKKIFEMSRDILLKEAKVNMAHMSNGMVISTEAPDDNFDN